MTRETLREQLIASGDIRPAGHPRKRATWRGVLRTDASGIRSACLDILDFEDARAVAQDPSADPRVRLFLSRALERRAAA